jgi:hypothetical protein
VSDLVRIELQALAAEWRSRGSYVWLVAADELEEEIERLTRLEE